MITSPEGLQCASPPTAYFPLDSSQTKSALALAELLALSDRISPRTVSKSLRAGAEPSVSCVPTAIADALVSECNCTTPCTTQVVLRSGKGLSWLWILAQVLSQTNIERIIHWGSPSVSRSSSSTLESWFRFPALRFRESRCKYPSPTLVSATIWQSGPRLSL